MAGSNDPRKIASGRVISFKELDKRRKSVSGESTGTAKIPAERIHQPASHSRNATATRLTPARARFQRKELAAAKPGTAAAAPIGPARPANG